MHLKDLLSTSEPDLVAILKGDIDPQEHADAIKLFSAKWRRSVRWILLGIVFPDYFSLIREIFCDEGLSRVHIAVFNSN